MNQMYVIAAQLTVTCVASSVKAFTVVRMIKLQENKMSN